jgi:ligand-binding sensor domain-containing protein/two-component sensor histidine kinase
VVLWRAWWWWTIGLFAALVPAQLFGQQYGFTQWTPKQGLAQSQVRCMAQDSKGYLWFGTLGGASRFDGRTFANYALQEGLPDAQINAMVDDGKGTLWLAAGAQLAHIRGRTVGAEPLPASSRNARIMGLCMDASGRLFIGTDGGGMFLRDSTGIRALEGYPSDTASNIRSLQLLRDGSLLIGTRNGLLRWRHGTCVPVQVGDATPKTITAIAVGHDGTWWIGTADDGLYQKAPDGREQHFDEESGLLLNNVRCILVDDQDRTWVGTKFGLNMLEGGKMRVYTIHQGMPNDYITSAFQDSEGDLWFGTDGAGALRYAGDHFVSFTIKDGLCSDLVMSITADAQGDLWLGTYDNGVCRFDGMATINTFDGLPNNTVWCGLLDAQGRLWFGTSEGLACVERGVVIERPELDTLADQRIVSLFEDRDGAIWCGMREGLARVDPLGGVTIHPAGSAGAGRSIRSITQDENGVLWLATENGLRRFDGRSFTGLTTLDGLCDNTVQSLCWDHRGRLWAGTTNGLSCWDGDRFRTVRFANDFGSNFIDLLRMDSRGRMWAGTNNGLFLFHPDSALVDARKHHHFTTTHGLRSLEFNLNASFADRSGRILFGSTGGLVHHRVDRMGDPADLLPPRIHLTGLRSFLQPSEWTGQSQGTGPDGLPIGLHLAYRKNYLTFDYIGISLSIAEKVRYRYRLIGYDQDWLPITDARFASYSNLSHGSYTFQVSATVDGRTWSPPVSFSFEIERPYWLKWWFFTLCALGLTGMGLGIHRYRMAIRQRHERTRQLMLRSRMLQLEQQALNANMNRHFVFNALNSIQYHINKQDRTTASRYLTSFAKLIRKNLDASQNDTTSLAEELERLELYLTLEHMRFKDKFKYTILVDPTVDTRHVQLPAMMLQPYVENSIWHGILPMDRQGQVVITVKPSGPLRVSVVIEDDGVGVDRSLGSKKEMPSDHISRGIEITKGRADVLRKLDLSDIRIQGPEQRNDPSSGAVLGTRVSIELPA